jgi:hypothetical protein
MITTLGLQDFEISIQDDKGDKSEKLVFGKYWDDEFKTIGETIDNIMQFFYFKEGKEKKNTFKI